MSTMTRNYGSALARGTMLAAVLGLGLSTLGVGGCTQKAKTGSYNLVVTPDAGLNRVEVDLVGVKADELCYWQKVDVADYFSGNNAMRQGSRSFAKTLTVSGAPQTVAVTDPIWKEWQQRQISHVFILAGGRGVAAKKELPVTTVVWDVSTINLIVKQAAIDVPTPTRAAKQQ